MYICGPHSKLFNIFGPVDTLSLTCLLHNNSDDGHRLLGRGPSSVAEKKFYEHYDARLAQRKLFFTRNMMSLSLFRFEVGRSYFLFVNNFTGTFIKFYRLLIRFF